MMFLFEVKQLWKMKLNVNIVVLVVACVSIGVDSSQEVMQRLSMNFGKAYESCKKEHNFPDTVDAELFNFWKEDNELGNRLTGCAIACMSHKLDLVDPEGKLHHGNAQEFAKKHGADDAMVAQLSDLLHKCEDANPMGADNDACVRVLGIAKCYRAEIHKLNWAPSMDLVMGEVLSDV